MTEVTLFHFPKRVCNRFYKFCFSNHLEMKDLFSDKSANYASFRPGYPPELFSYLKNNLKTPRRAWDCGTGNGQVAAELAEFMEKVEATDISRQQLKYAIQINNINYSLQQAEKTNFPEKFFDLVTVAQAIHWFDFAKFYAEVKRVLKADGLIAVMGYSLFRSNPETDAVIDQFYRETISAYWDPERKYLEEAYQTISFPFSEVPTPDFHMQEIWSLERLVGYLRTWSAVKRFHGKTGKDPVTLIEKDLQKNFGKRGQVTFPILLRLGKLH